MRNIFDQYSQPENRLTHALISSLNEDKKLLSSFIKKFCNNYFSDVSLLKIDQQTLPGLKSLQNLEGDKKGLPDGVIYNDEKCLIIECKINLELTEDQLIRHERTVKRKGFDNTFGLTITKDPISNINLKNWIHITWKEVYNWAHEEKSKSNWSLKLLDYFNVAENKMVEDEYLTEGSITEFNGIHFDKENEYTYLEGKRLLKLLIKKIKLNKELEKQLNIDLKSKGRGGIKDEGAVWDILTFNNSKKTNFTSQPHATIHISPENAGMHLAIPNGMSGKYKKNLKSLTWVKFEEMVFNIAKNYNDNFNNNSAFRPSIEIHQRRWPSINAKYFSDGKVNFDLRTAFKEFASMAKPEIKVQKEWLKIVYDFIQNKNSNIQIGFGAEFYFTKHNMINNKDGDQVIVKSLLSLKPLVDVLFK